jgi:energy-coupling factor transporter ATP-binding protein EcfA2
MQPEVLLLDEPMAGLDAAMQVELQALLDRLAGRGITIVLSTHDVDFAYRWADDIHLLAAGRCLASFAAADLRSTRCPAHRRPAAAGRRRIPPRVGRPRAGRQHATAQPGRSARSSHFQGHRMISGCFSRSPCQVPTMLAKQSPGTVWFVGAGPGDPDLITVKGRQLLEQAGAILFAGSLVDRAATLFAPAGCEIRDSKDMTLEEMSAWLSPSGATPRWCACRPATPACTAR